MVLFAGKCWPPDAGSSTSGASKYFTFSHRARKKAVFVGFSELAVPANAGHKGLRDACVATFGTKAKMANSREIINAPEQPVGSGKAWVMPTDIKPFGYSSYFGQMDYSGVRGSSTLDCQSWSVVTTSGSNWGLFVNQETYSLSLDRCDLAKQVACSILP